MVIESIVERMDPKYQDEMRASLQELCEVAWEEQRQEFQRIASTFSAPAGRH
jgi:hypothetical protein